MCCDSAERRPAGDRPGRGRGRRLPGSPSPVRHPERGGYGGHSSRSPAPCTHFGWPRPCPRPVAGSGSRRRCAEQGEALGASHGLSSPGVRVAGSLCVVAGLALAALLFLLPTQLHVLGSSVDCGVPVFQAFEPLTTDSGSSATNANGFTSDEINECIVQSRHRLIAGAVAGGVLAVGGGVMVGAIRTRRSNQIPLAPSGWYPDPANNSQLRWWDGQSWTNQQRPR